MDGTVKRVIKGAHDRFETPYRFWHEGVDWYDVQALVPPWNSRPGYNCTSSFNDIFGEMRDEGYATYPHGGTTDYCSALGSDGTGNWERFKIQKNYPPGVFLVSPFTSDQYQGHNAMVLAWEDSSHNQYMLQSDAGDGVSDDWNWGWPGLNEKRTMAETDNFSGFLWAGTLPGVPLLDGCPGTKADGKALALYSAEVMDWYGLPRHYFANACLTENKPVMDPDRQYEDINEVPGYWTPVVDDSYGPLQMRHEYWPLPWNFECSVLCFAQAIYAAYGTDVPDDQEGTSQTIQSIWKSFDSTDSKSDSNYVEQYAWAVELTKADSADAAPKKEEVKEKVNWIGIGADDALRFGGDYSKGYYVEDNQGYPKRVM